MTKMRYEWEEKEEDVEHVGNEPVMRTYNHMSKRTKRTTKRNGNKKTLTRRGEGEKELK